MVTFSQFLDALFANHCVLCNRLGASCCEKCLEGLDFRSRKVQRYSLDGKSIEGLSAIDFNPRVAALVHAFKDQHRSALAGQFADFVVPLVAQTLGTTEAADVAEVHLVAVPSSASSMKARGFSPGAEIAKAVVKASCLPAKPARLRHSSHLVWRQTDAVDQASLGQEQRKLNLQLSMVASPKAFGKAVIMVDDIVTTGASLFETARALEVAGAKVLGFVTFSETILRNILKRHTNETKKV
jgi:predicted amidophosphoribosyltransferase